VLRRVIVYEDDEILVEAVYVDDPYELVYRALAERPMSYREVVERLPLSWKRAQHVLARLVAQGRVCVERGVYRVCDNVNNRSRMARPR